MRAVYLAVLEMQRGASLVLLALVREVALNNIERLGHAFVKMCRNHRAGLHTDVQHYWPQRVIRVADPQCDVALTGEWEAICLELTVKHFMIDHDTAPAFERLTTLRTPSVGLCSTKYAVNMRRAVKSLNCTRVVPTLAKTGSSIRLWSSWPATSG